MEKRAETVAIVGVGLLGASLGLALKSRGLAGTIRGVGRRESSLSVALERGAVDSVTLKISEAVHDADLIVICTPAARVVADMDAVFSVCRPDAVVTDVASTKAVICEYAKEHCPPPRRFVGGHPMAGSEKFGPEHGDEDLFEGAVTFVERQDGHARDARDAVCRLWSEVGSRVVDVDPGVHDEMVAKTSHVPHVLAGIMARVCGEGGSTADFVGNGFRDATRLADGRPEIWRDICLTNAGAITDALDGTAEQIISFTEALRGGDGDALETFFEKARAARRSILDE